MRQFRTGVVDGGVGVGGGAGIEDETEDGEGEAEVGVTEAAAGDGGGTGAAATPSTGVLPHPATGRKEIANNTASVLRRIFPPAAAIWQNEAEP
ncbi:hypothetical protein [Amycolatopsis sp. Hca4]|uniref:hypothetical protein n=1 Tax=Amycolatopsis sp. Hca4 TaxID=2742131 RepID=UPI0020CB00C4|nr:hypothetical protein [Amycolatopsis sp. Hca4]